MTEERHESILPMRCVKCKTAWDEHYSLPMVFSALLNRLKLRCPKCGAKSKYIVIVDKANNATSL